MAIEIEEADDKHWEGLLQCPRCSNTSIESDTEVHRYPDRDAYEVGNPLGTRGEYATIAMDCAKGHRLTFAIGNHKGTQKIGLYVSE